jgi:hypothetical protein
VEICGCYYEKNCRCKWIFSRGEALLLAATDTTSGMPGGMERLNHSNEYKRLCQKVKKKGIRDQGTGIREQGSGNRDQGTGIRDQGSGIRDQGSGIRDQGSGEI